MHCTTQHFNYCYLQLLNAQFADASLSFLFYSEAKTCLSEKRVAFVGDSRIRQLFYSFIKIIDPERREEGNKVMMRNSFSKF